MRKIYAGKSAVWANRDAAYFAPNGTAKNVFTDDSDGGGPERWTGYATGTWSVSGNRMCWNMSGVAMNVSTKSVGQFRNSVWCWEWYKDGSKYYTRHTHKGRVSGFSTDAVTKLHSGDKVSGWFAEYKAKLKR